MNAMGVLDRFKIPTPRPSLVEAAEEIESAMFRLKSSTDRLEDLLSNMNEQASRRASERIEHGA